MNPCVLNQLNIINRQCMVFVYIAAMSCHTYIMENAIKPDMMRPLTASWNDIFVQFVCITIISNLIFQEDIEVNITVVHK